MRPEQQEIMLSFIEETQEHLAIIEAGLFNLPSTAQNIEAFNTVVRATHTIKGSSAMLDLQSIRSISTQMEDVFKQIQAHPTAVDHTVSDLLFRALGALNTLLVDLEQDLTLSEAVADKTVRQTESVFATLDEHLMALRQPNVAHRQPRLTVSEQPADRFSFRNACHRVIAWFKTLFGSIVRWLKG